MEERYEMKSVAVGYAADGATGSRNNRDAADMAKLGKRQQLNRNFGFMSMLGFATTIMGTWEAVHMYVIMLPLQYITGLANLRQCFLGSLEQRRTRSSCKFPPSLESLSRITVIQCVVQSWLRSSP